VAQAWIGTSGWSYKHWAKVFYPDKLPAKEHLAFYAQHFSTVEINYSYYQLPPRKTFELWRRKSPDGFVFAVKASRYLTHMKKLKEPEQPLERLLHNAGGLGPKLGPVLFQFPRRWALNMPRLEDFFKASASTAAATASRSPTTSCAPGPSASAAGATKASTATATSTTTPWRTIARQRSTTPAGSTN
jgi:uncharacterized protein YecE (DUF72 family)